MPEIRIALDSISLMRWLRWEILALSLETRVRSENIAAEWIKFEFGYVQVLNHE